VSDCSGWFSQLLLAALLQNDWKGKKGTMDRRSRLAYGGRKKRDRREVDCYCFASRVIHQEEGKPQLGFGGRTIEGGVLVVRGCFDEVEKEQLLAK
jgi:hypothetical protein